jgi:hypothetical protein
LQDPVRSKYGDVFERGTIEMWLDQQGQVCPITGNALSKEDLTEDRELINRISGWYIQQTLAHNDPFESVGNLQPPAGGDDEDDLYDF